MAWDDHIPITATMQVIDKLSSGTYATEATRCFCGADPSRDTDVVKWDRYSIPHRMVMCEDCLLMRANPRMTADAYERFYNTEYRVIYDGFPYKERSRDPQFLYDLQVTKSMSIKTVLTELQVTMPTKCVVDLGSNKGGGLQPFKEDGLEVWGVEWDRSGREYANSRGIPTVATIEELIEKGVQADLILLQDVVEHFLDLRVELSKLKAILAPEGRVFIYTPGLLATPPSRVFQNAHTWQFIGETLNYVMEELGYFADFVDDQIVSLWSYVGREKLSPVKPVHWRRYVIEHLNQEERRAVPPVRTRCKFGEQETLANIKANLVKKYQTLEALQNTRSGAAMVLGAGPSVEGQLDKIRAMQADGVPLIVIERMYPWAVQHGLKVDYAVVLDATPGVEEGLTHLQPETIHLIAATTHPSILPILDDAGATTYLFSGLSGTLESVVNVWRENGYTKIPVVSTGGSVVLGSFYLGLILGFTHIHLFGFDCMTPDAAHDYVEGVAGESVKRTYFPVEVGEERVLTCSSFLAFAQQFFRMVAVAASAGMLKAVDIHGESLVNKMFEAAPSKDDAEHMARVEMSSHPEPTKEWCNG